MISTRPVSATRVFAMGLLAPLAISFTACSADADDGGPAAGDPIEAIAAPEGASWTDIVTVSAEDGYVLGNPDAPIKLVEYASHTCGHCATFAANGKPGVKKYVKTGVVSFELRNLVRDPIDLAIATLVRCGAKENMQTLSDLAWGNIEETFQNVNQNGPAYEAAGRLPVEQRFIQIAQAAGLIEFFAARGISEDQARQCLADAKAIEAIANRSTEQSNELGLTGTPTFILNGRKLDVNTWRDLEPILQRAGARTE